MNWNCSKRSNSLTEWICSLISQVPAVFWHHKNQFDSNTYCLIFKWWNFIIRPIWWWCTYKITVVTQFALPQHIWENHSTFVVQNDFFSMCKYNFPRFFHYKAFLLVISLIPRWFTYWNIEKRDFYMNILLWPFIFLHLLINIFTGGWRCNRRYQGQIKVYFNEFIANVFGDNIES